MATIQLRRGPQANLAGASASDGEPLWTIDTHRLYISQGGVKYEVGGSSGVSDGDKGDITVSGGGTTWTIDTGAVTYSKIQNVAASRILGRGDSGAGPLQEITIGAGLSLSGTTLSCTVSAPAFAQSVVESSGVVTLVNDAAEPGANKVYGTNSSGVRGWRDATTVISDGDKGDITVSGGGTTWTIDDGAVTLKKLANFPEFCVIGTRGTLGPPEFLNFYAPGTGLQSSVVPPYTKVLTFSLANHPVELPNKFLATPTSGIATPNREWRAIAPSDVVLSTQTSGNLPISRVDGVSTNRLLGRTTDGTGAVEHITVGTGMILANGTLACTVTSNPGTVTSVGLAMPAQFAVTDSPVTGSGTLTAAWNTQSANEVLAGPTSGSAAAPTFRALVEADLPTSIGINRVRFSGVRCRMSGALASSTAWNAGTPIAFTSEEYDTDSYHDNVTNNTRLTAPVAGYYRIWGAFSTANDWISSSFSNSGSRLLRIRKNGDASSNGTLAVSGISYSWCIETSTTAYLAANDYVELLAVQSHGTTRNIVAQFGMELVGR